MLLEIVELSNDQVSDQIGYLLNEFLNILSNVNMGMILIDVELA